MDDSFLVFGAPAIERDEIEEVVKCLESGWLGTGPKVAQFERDFAHYKNVNHAAAVNSCTAALHLSLLVAGIGPGDEVITTPLTFCATVNAIIHAGATPVLADVDVGTMNINPERVIEKITSKTKALLPVHFAGRSCNMDDLMAIAQQYDLKVIEDCAHAIETTYKGRPVGTFGDFGCFSFYVTKNIVTGEGGMVIAKSAKDIARVKQQALHGMSKDAWHRFGDEGYKHYQVVECGFKYNMTDMQAAIGIHQLRRVGAYWEKRKLIWEQYNDAFSELSIGLPFPIENDSVHAYHLYTIQVNEGQVGLSRDEFLNKMTQSKIGVGVHYLSIPEHPFYQSRFGWKPEDYPNAMKVGRETVSLPISAALDQAAVTRVIDTVKDILL